MLTRQHVSSSRLYTRTGDRPPTPTSIPHCSLACSRQRRCLVPLLRSRAHGRVRPASAIQSLHAFRAVPPRNPHVARAAVQPAATPTHENTARPCHVKRTTSGPHDATLPHTSPHAALDTQFACMDRRLVQGSSGEQHTRYSFRTAQRQVPHLCRKIRQDLASLQESAGPAQGRSRQ